MTNVTSRASQIDIPLSELNVPETRWYDLIGEKDWIAEQNKITVRLQPYEVIWLKPQSDLTFETDNKRSFLTC
jgi:sucrose phosphorylase